LNHYFDDKQKRIISSWLARSRSLTADPYAAFMALWISFNAYCYALYAKKAQKRRADLRVDKGLRLITSEPSRAECTISLESERFKIEIEQPGRISIMVSEKYTEDVVFSEFAKQFQQQYSELLKGQDFHASVETFQKSLYKKDHDKYYVVNMARSNEYDPSGNYESMVAKNIIIPFEDINDLKQLKNALYQVRCNVFHGEKVPGDINDDRIVKTAYPVLLSLMESCAESAV